MKKVVYSKFSNERDKRFDIRTDILMDEEKNKVVYKTSCFEEGKAHVKNMRRWYEELSRIFAGTGIFVNQCTLVEDGAELEFLKGSTLEKELHQLWSTGEKELAWERMGDYLDIIRGCASQPFSMTDEFRDIFGDTPEFENALTMPVTDLDMVLGNIIVGENWNLIDYEWTFDFPIPVKFVVFRVIHYFFHGNADASREDFSSYYKREDISEEEMQAFQRMEESFQAYVVGAHVPLREMYGGISPGYVDMRGGENRSDFHPRSRFTGTVYYAKKGEAFVEERSLHKTFLLDDGGRFSVTFDFSELDSIDVLRYDPLEGEACRIRIDRVVSEAMMDFCPMNGFGRGGEDTFWNQDPAYILNGEFSCLGTLTIEGRVTFMEERELLETLTRQQDELLAVRAKAARYRDKGRALQSELHATRNTKGYQAMEKVRTARNFAKSKVRQALPNKPVQEQVRQKTPYQQWFEAHQASREELERQRNHRFIYEPVISILVPAYNTPIKYLHEMVGSVLTQTYPKWELCIADGSCGNRELAEALKAYARKDSRIKYVLLDSNQGISENTNQAVPLAAGEYIALLDHDDVLAPNALCEVVQALQDKKTDIVYTDEDKVNADLTEHMDPNLKPDFSIDLLRSHNYITHLFVVRSTIFHEIGGFRKEFDGAQDHDLMFRCIERSRRIKHVPKILYYWRMHSNSTAENPESKLYAYEAGRRAIWEHLKRVGTGADVETMKLWGMNHVSYHTPGNPLVSIIIPNKDHIEDLKLCVSSIMKKSAYKNIEFVIVENNSEKEETFAFYRKLTDRFANVRVVKWESGFNYSAINNFGVRHAKGDYLLFLNNDTELLSPGGIQEMLGCCMRREVGCVGAKLLFADDTVQHAGIVLGFGGFAGHVFSGIGKDDLGFMMRPMINCNYSAVTAACMMMRREVFEETGGFNEEFAVALNDVELCMRIRQKDYLIVYNAFSIWHHYESKSRGYEDTPQKQARFRQEVEKFRAVWKDVVDAPDPYYNKNFSVDRAPFTLW